MSTENIGDFLIALAASRKLLRLVFSDSFSFFGAKRARLSPLSEPSRGWEFELQRKKNTAVQPVRKRMQALRSLISCTAVPPKTEKSRFLACLS